MTTPLWPLAIFFILTVILVAAILGLSFLLGERHWERTTGEPYESGILPTGSARRRIPVKYYLVAAAFVLFDLEAVYIFAWAAAFRDLGWAGYCQIVIFIAILLAALVYFWRIGALNWGPRTGNPEQQKGGHPGPVRTEGEVPRS
jgi:NADH-quinone oxidoreductase subunit A